MKIVPAFILAATTFLVAAPAMTVDDVVRLAKAGVSEAIIQTQIHAKGQTFDLTSDQLVALKSAGVSDQTIRIMMKPASSTIATAPAPLVQVGQKADASLKWLSHNDPMGFSVNYPAGWSLDAQPKSGRVLIQGPERQQAVLWPMFLENQQLEARGAAAMVGQLARRVDANMPWGTAQQEGNAVRVLARGQSKGVAMMQWNASAQGTSIYLACVTAPAAVYAGSMEAFTGILTSFHIVPDPKANTVAPAAMTAPVAVPPVAWVQWTDPREGAFNASVPRGWEASGGAFRHSPTDIRKSLVLVSPDRAIRIAVGDPNIGVFTAPNGMYARAGMRTAGLGDGTQLEIRPFAAAPQFVRQYVMGAIGRECSGLQIVSEDNASELATTAIERARKQGAMAPRVSAAGASFTCTWNGQQARGYYAAATVLPFPGRSGIWYVDELYGYLARERAQQAEEIAHHVLSSMGINAQWKQREDQIAGNAVAQDNQRSAEIQAQARKSIADNQQKTSDMIVKGYQDRSKVYDEISRKRENSILGTVDVIDPSSGKQYKIDNYSDYHWMNDSGVIAGTRTDSSPGPGWRQMIDLP